MMWVFRARGVLVLLCAGADLLHAQSFTVVIDTVRTEGSDFSVQLEGVLHTTIGPIHENYLPQAHPNYTARFDSLTRPLILLVPLD